MLCTSPSMGLKNTPRLIAMVKGARGHGLDVTTECYPYTAGSTQLESAIFDPGWQDRQASPTKTSSGRKPAND